MFSIKELWKENLAIVDTELDLKIETEHRIVDLKTLIKDSEQLEKEFDFVKEFSNTTVSNCMHSEKYEAEMLKMEKENLKSDQDTLYIEKTKLELIKAQLEISKVQTDGINSDTRRGGGEMNKIPKLIC